MEIFLKTLFNRISNSDCIFISFITGEVDSRYKYSKYFKNNVLIH